MSSPADDLFSPSLTEEHDAKGFDKPWSPDGLVLLSVFCGLPGAGVFWVDNWRRLGKAKHQISTAAAIVIFSGVLLTTAEWLQLTGVVPRETRGSWISFGMRLAGIVVAIVIAHHQRKRYRLFELTGLPKGKWIIPIVVSLAVTLVFSVICMGLARLIHLEFVA
jgi:hypothetical protein